MHWLSLLIMCAATTEASSFSYAAPQAFGSSKTHTITSFPHLKRLSVLTLRGGSSKFSIDPTAAAAGAGAAAAAAGTSGAGAAAGTTDTDTGTGTGTNTAAAEEEDEGVYRGRRLFGYKLNFIQNFFTTMLSSVISDPDVVRIGTNVLSAVLWLSLALSALGTLGVDTKPLLSLVGISGITLGLSVKDILSDTYAGIFVLVIRPFKRGSHIEVAGFKGKVLSTNIRYVRLLSADNMEILLPLSVVYKSAIKIKRMNAKEPKEPSE